MTLDPATDRPLKARHRAMWASGDYPLVARTVIPDLGAVLVDASDVRAGQTVLDVAAGSGNAAVPAAATGARVVASDLTPELFDVGREAAARAGVHVEVARGGRRGDALRRRRVRRGALLRGRDVRAASPDRRRRAGPGLPARRDHRAGQLDPARVHRPAARGRCARMRRRARPGAQPPPLWGDEEHVRSLLGDRRARRVGAAAGRPGGGVHDAPGVPRVVQGPLRAGARGLPVSWATTPSRVPQVDAALDELAGSAEHRPEGFAGHGVGVPAADRDAEPDGLPGARTGGRSPGGPAQ